ncbi:MAG: N-acetylneuraminate synthase [Muribaculaceae bacterium]|nr:N-acetylneuraminate synthase [Muribaculaceae bacterium]
MSRTLIIAEAGVNHNGSVEMALRLVDAAAEAGADMVKFQTFKAKNLVTAAARKAEYQVENTHDGSEGQLEMLSRLELSEDDHRALMQRCKERGIEFLSTPFDEESVDFLASLGITTWKIPSGEITNYLLIKKIAARKGHVILSTGMSGMDDVEAALNLLEKFGKSRNDVTVLHCTTQYPAPYNDVNLLCIKTMREALHVQTGYSDHTPGIEIPVAAAALGATVIEKHFTLDRSLPGPDHKASLEPAELSEMVKGIRNVEKALGDGVKRVADSERKNIAVARKSIVARNPIHAGEMLTEENLGVKRPGTGISPMRWEEVIGKKAKRDFEIDELIEL